MPLARGGLRRAQRRNFRLICLHFQEITSTSAIEFVRLRPLASVLRGGNRVGPKPTDNQISMKKIEAIIKPFEIREVKRALGQVGINRMTVTEVKEFGCHYDHIEIYRGNQHLVDFLPSIKIEVVVTDQQLDQALEAISGSAKTEGNSEGEILVFPVEQVVRFGTSHANGVPSFRRS